MVSEKEKFNPKDYDIRKNIKVKCACCDEAIEGNAEQILDYGWTRAYGEWWCQGCSDNMP